MNLYNELHLPLSGHLDLLQLVRALCKTTTGLLLSTYMMTVEVTENFSQRILLNCFFIMAMRARKFGDLTDASILTEKKE